MTIYNSSGIPLAPIKLQARFDKDAWWFACPACNEAVDFKKNCKLCGQRIDWASILTEESEDPNETIKPNYIVNIR